MICALRIFNSIILYGSCMNIFVYTIDGLELYTIYEARYTLVPTYTRAIDGGAPWVFIPHIRRTPPALL